MLFLKPLLMPFDMHIELLRTLLTSIFTSLHDVIVHPLVIMDVFASARGITYFILHTLSIIRVIVHTHGVLHTFAFDLPMLLFSKNIFYILMNDH